MSDIGWRFQILLPSQQFFYRVGPTWLKVASFWGFWGGSPVNFESISTKMGSPLPSTDCTSTLNSAHDNVTRSPAKVGKMPWAFNTRGQHGIRTKRRAAASVLCNRLCLLSKGGQFLWDLLPNCKPEGIPTGVEEAEPEAVNEDEPDYDWIRLSVLTLPS